MKLQQTGLMQTKAHLKYRTATLAQRRPSTGREKAGSSAPRATEQATTRMFHRLWHRRRPRLPRSLRICSHVRAYSLACKRRTLGRAFSAVHTAIRHCSHSDPQIERMIALISCPPCLTLTGAAKIVPDEPEPFIILGVLSVIAGKYEDAIDHMKAALENDPTDYTLWNKLGAVQTHSSQVFSPTQSSPVDSPSLSLPP